MITLKYKNILKTLWNNFLLTQILTSIMFISDSYQISIVKSQKSINPVQNVLLRRINFIPHSNVPIPNTYPSTSKINSDPFIGDYFENLFYKQENFSILKGLDDVGPVTFPPDAQRRLRKNKKTHFEFERK